MSYSEFPKISLGEDRDTRISLAKQKLKKFRKKKATASGADNLGDGIHEGIDEGADDFSGRSSPSVDSVSGLGNHKYPFPSSTVVEQLYERRISDNGLVQTPYDNNESKGYGRQFSNQSIPAADIFSSRVRSYSTQETLDNSQNISWKHDMEEMKETIQRLKKELEMERSSVESRILREHQNLREQLNGHIQTIGILVAEKTELQGALTRADHIAKKKANEAEGYASKLTELRQNFTECERRLNETQMNGDHKNSSLQEQADLYSKHIADLRLTNEKHEKSIEELRDELFGTKKKLGAKDMDSRRLEQQIVELQSQQRISHSHDTHSHAEQYDSILRDKKALEWKVQEYQTELSVLRKDMDEMVSRYQASLAQAATAKQTKPEHYITKEEVEEILVQNSQLKSELDALEHDKEFLSNTAAQQKKLLDELQQQQNSVAFTVQQKTDIIQQYQARLDEQNQELVRLKTLNEQLSADAADRGNLLASVESDKIALSRAVAQNYELKRLLDSLTMELQREKEQSYQLRTEVSRLETAERFKDLQTSIPVNSAAPPALGIRATLMHSQSQTDLDANASGSQSPSNAKAFEGKIRNLEDEIQMYKNRVIQADSEVIYLKNALRIKEEESKLLELTERVGAYKTLEHKFVTAMKQNAELQDQVDQLEHIILQLQGETETIGDYIALYQNQRSLQKQRDNEKIQQIERLLEERETMKLKMSKLSGLLKGKLNDSDTQQRGHHIDLPSGDTPDASVAAKDHNETSLDYNGNSSDEYPLGSKSLNSIGQQQDENILALLNDIDNLVKADQNMLSTNADRRFPMRTPYCPCCVGVLRVV